MEMLTADEARLIGPYVSNTTGGVFAIHGLPEAVKAGLFARYSRSTKGLRRLLLDEFADVLDPDRTDDLDEGDRARELLDRVVVQFGDDSVAAGGGAHAAVEGASNLLAKQLEWGRLAAYLEKSTRYVPYTDRVDGRYRYVRPQEIVDGPHLVEYERVLDGVFDIYAGLIDPLQDMYRARHPQDRATSDVAYRNTIRAKALDTARGLLPAATSTNVGIFASGQAWENALMRMRGHELAEVRDTGDALLGELRTVIPSFLRRIDMPDRGIVWTDYLASLPRIAKDIHDREIRPTFGPERPGRPGVRLVAHSPDGADIDVIVGLLYGVSDLPEDELRFAVARMPTVQRADLLKQLAGNRTNRRHKPGRGLERAWYRFEVVSDYGAFRDLQRHRMATIDWQPLSPVHGYTIPDDITDLGGDHVHAYKRALWAQADLHRRLASTHGPEVAQYAVGFAYNLRYSIQINARALMFMLELRTQPQGHPSYRRVCHEMHRLVDGVTPSIAAIMRYVDHRDYELERLNAERRTAAR
jgi:thymidylate synthase ThyX